MQGCTVDHAVIYLGSAAGQAYVALSRARSLDGSRIGELDWSKLTGPLATNCEDVEITHCDDHIGESNNKHNIGAMFRFLFVPHRWISPIRNILRIPEQIY
ncbi:unnamed protein product [Acanthoscelides obtectus]|uniref:Uncharacterized protein n=1 Tax=Acanthoscelides obtectus TaxID=200917 RepID=A0A9P0KGU0_ACAOB|nr:unnamed protein product [Acanthoscelides obtectus]CAK1627840.1 hypothetical protein AOBTE_LOCUS4852 [Acanthoscelides obtectus]